MPTMRSIDCFCRGFWPHFLLFLEFGIGLPGFENWGDFLLEFLNEFRFVAEVSVRYVQYFDLVWIGFEVSLNVFGVVWFHNYD